jgi:hypothetical protein
MFEIESSKLALDRSQAGPVKAFAQRMVDDHSAAAVKFKEAVLDAKLAMPPDKLDAKHRANVDELAGKQGGDFDKAYIEAQYKAHVETVDLFKGYAQGARIRGCARLRPSCCPPCRRISTTSPRCADRLSRGDLHGAVVVQGKLRQPQISLGRVFPIPTPVIGTAKDVACGQVMQQVLSGQ